MIKEKYTNATVFYNNSGERQTVFCTNRNLTVTLKGLKRCSWITDIEVIKYDFTEDRDVKFTKKDVEYYESNFKKLMNMVKAVKDEQRDDDYIVETPYGKLNVIMDNCLGEKILSIHTCFDDTDKGIEKFGCTSYCGKWNFYKYDITEGLLKLYDMMCQVLNKENIGEFI